MIDKKNFIFGKRNTIIACEVEAKFTFKKIAIPEINGFQLSLFAPMD